MTRHFDVALNDGQTASAVRMDPPWRHHFHFDNHSTGGLWDERHMDFIDARLPSVTDKSVLDIGFCDGYYAFRAEADGARRIVGVDIRARPSAVLVHEVLRSECLFLEEDIATWEDTETFDVVLCLGVFYHVPDLTALLAKCAEKTAPGGVAVFEGPVMFGRLNRVLRTPQWASLARPPAQHPNHHFWKPTLSTLVALLDLVDFDIMDIDFMWSRALVTARRRGP